jgi:U4/U6.U5 tri-snRNP-associated protein 2
MRLVNPVLKKCSLPPTDLSSSEQHPPPVYDLLANVIHESVAGTTRDKENTVWKVQLRAGSGENEKWFQIQDLIVEEVRKEMIFLGETVIQVRFTTVLVKVLVQLLIALF